jgi:signal peptide peptidase SppA
MRDQVLRLFCEHPLAILPAKLEQIEAFLQYRIAGAPAPAYAKGRPAESQRVSGGRAGAVAVIPIMGTITRRADLMTETSGGTSTDAIQSALTAALADPQISSIVLQIDSPGGSVFGVQELADRIYQARQRKRIVAQADDLAASAAYWIGSAASEFVMTPSGQVGSIGVVATHVDQSAALEKNGLKVTYVHAGENKVEGNPTEPLSTSARAQLQAMVDEYYSAFLASVARGRGVPRATVESTFGQGRVFGATQAKARGMVDRIATLADTVGAELARNPSRTAPSRASASAALAARRTLERMDAAIAEWQAEDELCALELQERTR